MSDGLPARPTPIPPPDRHQIERINSLYELSVPGTGTGWRARLKDRLRDMLARLLFRQQEFNAALVDHINRNDKKGIEAHHATARTIAWVQDKHELQIDEMRRHQEALVAWERRTQAAMASLAAVDADVRTSIGALQQTVHRLQRDVMRLSQAGPAPVPAASAAAPVSADRPSAPAVLPDDGSLEGQAYVGFEDQFRGSQDDIRQRLEDYLAVFTGAHDVVDLGCGRGEFLALLRERGVRARGADMNSAMVEVCREKGLDVERADALTYLRAQPDESLGGLFAAQVIEHLEPGYLTSLIDTAFRKLRPGAPIVLETINPACWYAFFESYIRDITHVRAIHPETLKYLLLATGFLQVELQYRSPYPEQEKLQPVAPNDALGDWAETLNANVEHLNRLLFTCLDYAAIGRRP